MLISLKIFLFYLQCAFGVKYPERNLWEALHQALYVGRRSWPLTHSGNRSNVCVSR